MGSLRPPIQELHDDLAAARRDGKTLAERVKLNAEAEHDHLRAYAANERWIKVYERNLEEAQEEARLELERHEPVFCPHGSEPPAIEPGSTYRLFVNFEGTVLVRLWTDGTCEVAKRGGTGETWGPPIYLTEEPT